MRVLAISDVHASEQALERLAGFLVNEKFDLVLIAGDITNRGPASYAEDFLDLFKKVRVLAVHGNMDPMEVVELLEQRGVLLHMRNVRIEGWEFAGFGGSSPTPFGTPSEYGEDEIGAGLGGIEIGPKTILLTHSPPYNCGFDVTRNGVKSGSRAIREVIEEKKPFMNICGHIHEREGFGMLGSTRIVKLPPAESCRAVEVTLGSGKAAIVEF